MVVALQHKAASEIRVNDCMSEKLFCCEPEHDIRKAMKTMVKQKVKRLPITDATGHVQGPLSIVDVIAGAERGARGISTPDLSFNVDDCGARASGATGYD